MFVYKSIASKEAINQPYNHTNKDRFILVDRKSKAGPVCNSATMYIISWV